MKRHDDGDAGQGPQDIWGEWLFQRRFGGNRRLFEQTMRQLGNIRDRILTRASIRPGDVVLDIGTGDGLLAIKALEMVGAEGTVIFSDISEDAVSHCREIMARIAPETGTRFMTLSASELGSIADGGVDVIVCRSVLIYVAAKRRAFEEFHRVLAPGGRISIGEPINRFSLALRKPLSYAGYDISPLGEIAEKVVSGYQRMQKGRVEGESDPMTDFDERDLLSFARESGFDNISLEYSADINSRSRFAGGWKALLNSAPNPNAPTLDEVLGAVLSDEERRAFQTFMQPLVDGGFGDDYRAFALLSGVKR